VHRKNCFAPQGRLSTTVVDLPVSVTKSI